MSESHEHFRIAEAAALSRKRDPAFASWATGYGVIEHDDVTQVTNAAAHGRHAETHGRDDGEHAERVAAGFAREEMRLKDRP